MNYFNKCLEDLDSLDEELLTIAEPVLTKKAMLIRRMEVEAYKRMNEIVDFAFANDPQLRDHSYAFTAEHDTETNRWFVFFNSDRVSYSEQDRVFEWRFYIAENLSKLFDYQRNAFAIQIYLIANYLEPDPICSKCYDTAKITQPKFAALSPGWWYTQNLLLSCSPLKKALKAKIREQYDRRQRSLVSWVARTQLQHLYRPGSRLFKRVEREFNLAKK